MCEYSTLHNILHWKNLINISLFLDILCKCTLQRTALAFGFCLDITTFVLFKKALCEKYLMPTLIDKKSVKN